LRGEGRNGLLSVKRVRIKSYPSCQMLLLQNSAKRGENKVFGVRPY